MSIKKDKIVGFLFKTGKKYSCKSAAKVLRLNEETCRKYLRDLYSNGIILRIKMPKSRQHRYFA
jgi:DNA-binding Lrp family transcriptional regulator